MHLIKPEAAIEAILFASGDAVYISDIASVIDIDINTAQKIINDLKAKYISENRGINIVIIEDKVQMCTSSDYHEYIQKLLGVSAKRKKLSPAMLETLAIIAYKQPVTKTEIAKIRGVEDADHVVKKLMEYKLIEDKGRLSAPGKPIVYGTTDAFLTHFGLNSLNNLPELNSNNSEYVREDKK